MEQSGICCVFTLNFYLFIFISSEAKQGKVISALATNHPTGTEEQARGRRGQVVIGQLEGSEQAAAGTERKGEREGGKSTACHRVDAY